MKWTNPGHEFDEIGKKFENIDKVYIYGRGEIGKSVGKLTQAVLDTKLVYIDRDEKSQIGNIISPSQITLEHIIKSKAVVILALGQRNAGIVLKELELKGLRLGENIFHHGEWLEYYIHIFLAYRHNKVMLEQCGVMAVYNCTLRCRSCMGSFPYFKNKGNVRWSLVKEDIDICFSKIDFVKLWGIGCGEAFLYKDMVNYISYTMENYGKQIGEFVLDTNGTIVPSAKGVLETMRDYGCIAMISDYSTVKGWKEKVSKTISALENMDVKYEIVSADYWIDMGWHKRVYDKVGSEERFNSCGMPCRIVKDGKLVYCIHSMTSNEALFDVDTRDDEFDLRGNPPPLDHLIKREIMEYNLGFNKNGALKMCGYCNGHVAINKTRIPVGEQLS